MQTFLPYTDFEECAKVLDNKRLGKQRLECVQILDSLENGGGWSNHPAVKMWKGHEDSLKYYMNCMIIEWIDRGFKNTIPLNELKQDATVPDWVDSKLTFSHRANLQRKDMKYYPWNGIDTDAPYWWPTGLKSKANDKRMREYYTNFRS